MFITGQYGFRKTTMAETIQVPKTNTEPIYEKLARGECLIIEKRNGKLVVACNDKGTVRIRTVPLPK